ncbi:MAG: hypothetical protein RLZZ501_1544 [Pseudomonadota bacterium]
MSSPHPASSPPLLPSAPAAPAVRVRRKASPPEPPARPPSRRRRGRRRGWRRRLGRLWRGLNRVPSPLLTLGLVAVVAGGLFLVNLAHWVIRKPSELLAPVSDLMVKSPAETWAAYGKWFRAYATARVPAELLAALAQIESAGNPAAQTYWRWSPGADDLFGFYRPASSSVGMFQMTAPAYADARRGCVRDHVVVPRGDPRCPAEDEPLRILPSHAIELTAVYLDRGAARLLANHPGAVSPHQRRDLTALLHLCGPGPAGAFVRRGFRLAPGERCGDHDPAAYLAEIERLTVQFRRLADAAE